MIPERVPTSEEMVRLVREPPRSRIPSAFLLVASLAWMGSVGGGIFAVALLVAPAAE